MTWWLNCTHTTSAFATCLIISTGWKSWVDILELSNFFVPMILSKWGCFSKILLIYFNNASNVSYLFLIQIYFLLERQHYKLFHALRDLQMSWTVFTKEFVYLFVYFGNFWNLLKKTGEFEFGFGIEVEFLIEFELKVFEVELNWKLF